MIWLEWRVTLRGFCDVFVLTLKEQLRWVFTYWDYTPVAGLSRERSEEEHHRFAWPYWLPTAIRTLLETCQPAGDLPKQGAGWMWGDTSSIFTKQIIAGEALTLPPLNFLSNLFCQPLLSIFWLEEPHPHANVQWLSGGISCLTNESFQLLSKYFLLS